MANLSSSSASTSMKHLLPDLSRNLSQEDASFTSNSSWDELDKLFSATLNHSGIVINDVVLDNKSPDEDGLDRSIVAREITKTLKSNFHLKKQIDDLHCALHELKSQMKTQREEDQMEYRRSATALLNTCENYMASRIE